MKLPSKIEILGVPWKVLYFENASEVDTAKRKSLWGLCDSWTRTLRIYTADRPAEENLITLFHECIHAICDTLHLDDLNENEKYVDLLALAFMNILTKNGWLKDELE